MLAITILLGFTVLTFGLNEAEFKRMAELVEHVNSVQDSWQATTDHGFTNRVKEIFLLHGTCTHTFNKAKKVGVSSLMPDASLPKNFDAREKWGKICPNIGKVFDQSACGSCWAFGTSEAMSDRLCVATKGKKKAQLSAANLMDCTSGGCNGGSLESAYEFYQDEGLVTGSDYKSKAGCQPYPFKPCAHHQNKTHYPPCTKETYPTPPCSHKCQPSYKTPYEKDKSYGGDTVNPESETDIQKEIFTNGPVSAAFVVFDDFLSYKRGVYRHVKGEFAGLHAIKLLGWGEEKGRKYWLAANSWNEDWGDKGFFKILRGTDECGIESGIIASLPRK